MPLAPPVSMGEIEKVEQETGIAFSESLREFYQLTNGSGDCGWLVVPTDELTFCTFPTLDKCLSWWREWLPYDQSVHDQWGPTEEERDAKIRPEFYVHKGWFPIAETNCWGTTVFFDADPTEKGIYGQIIAYQHDPDAIYFTANSFSDFLVQSNDLLEQHADEILFCDEEPNIWAPPRL